MVSRTEILIASLKFGWLSNYRASQMLKSHSADRLMRFIRANPPKGYEFIEKIETKPNYHKQFKLVEGEGKL